MTEDRTPTDDPLSGDATPEISSELDRAHPRIRFTVETTRYETIRVLDRRSNGEVVLLAERHLPHGLAGWVTIKRLRNPATFERCQRLIEEVQLAFRLHHPAIAQVHHLKIHSDSPHIIAEHVDGPSLDTLISLATMREKPLSAPFALYIAAEVADALHHAHTLKDEEHRPLGIIHRDVAPRNIRVARSGEAKVTHFGAAYSRMVGREETPDLLLKGDVAYASPEYLHRKPMDGRSDIFSLGLVLLEMLTNKHLFDMEDATAPVSIPGVMTEELPSVPFTQMMALVNRYGPEDVERAVAGLPDMLKAILHKALQRKPSERYATAAQMRDALRGALAVESPRFERQEASEELARLLSEASVLRDRVELDEEGFFPEGLDADDVVTPSPDTK
ncbi:serine/threonine protein kinase [Corallococcus praedator]|uniref:Serine/threonine protein kinase n=1 Tax=Corallococcus praedator TaxID=2316724 RepID=A0ABX9QQS7_9BACT|nr:MULTISPECIES: serine/threonine-protein kinase [Corallococcus]RKH36368.1 serine/threonine protein kinase [Corallococcus sp. CA031C]RKI16584.1 serine/threonine protein kinase [Corallococcus praedator]